MRVRDIASLTLRESSGEPEGYPQRLPRQTGDRRQPWHTVSMNPSTLKQLARVGYAARGIVYAILGFVALSAAVSSKPVQGENAVWHTLLQQPFGKALLAMVGAGLLAYAIYRTVQAINDTEGRGSSTPGLLHRAGAMGSALANTVLGLAALGVAVPAAKKATGGGQGSSQSLTAEALSQPFGEWLVGFAGLLLMIVGLYQIALAWGKSFKDKLLLEQMSQTEELWATRAGTIGIAARGLVFLVTGALVVRAGFTESPGQAGSLEATLRTFEALGPWYLILVAVGLCAFAAYQLFLARYPDVHAAAERDRSPATSRRQ